MDFGFATLATPGFSIEQIAGEAKKYGFNSVDIRVRNDGEIKPDITKSEAERIREILGEIKLSSLLCYNHTIADDDEKMVETVLSAAELCELLDAESIRIFTSQIDETNYERLMVALHRIFKAYKGSKRILIQNHAGNGLTCPQAIEVAKELQSPNFGFILSPDEGFKRDEEFMHLIPELVKITDKIFVADMTAEKKYCLIGDGVIPFKDIISEMQKYGFDGNITLKWEKCWCDYLPEYDKGFESFINYFKN